MPDMVSTVAPTAASERFVLLDALRGFALLGVFMANMLTFSGWFTASAAEQMALAGGVVPRDLFTALFTGLVDGKFYTIFSFLFGIGFALQLDRLEARGDRAPARFRRRLFGLLAIGLIHLVLIWFGDILTLYALAGFVLLTVRGWSDRRLLTLAAVLVVLPVPGTVLLHMLGIPADFGFTALSERTARALGGDPAQFNAAWVRRPDWASFAQWQLSSAVWRIGSLLEQWRTAKVIAIMLLGLWAGRRLIAGTLFSDRGRLWRVFWWGLALGVPGNLLYAAMGDVTGGFGTRLLLAEAGYGLGVIPLGLAYAAGFALLWSRSAGVLGLFAAPGRMALTNYLTQSVLGVLIGHGIGLGLAGRLDPGQFVPLTLAIFAGQAVLSALWLRYLGQGPFERLWRWMTYGGTHRALPAAA
jgi:uncharacterized protein